jgi:phage terminase large subunit
VKRLFIDRKYHQSEKPEDYTFIQARVWDNLPMLEGDEEFMKALRRLMREAKTHIVKPELVQKAMHYSGYVRQLDALPPELRDAWLNGDWNVFAGQYFNEFDEKVHVIEPFVIPDWWRKSVAIDYGLDTLAVLWFAVDPHGQTYCYRDFEEKNLVISSAARVIRDLTPERVECFIAPPDLWNRRQDTGKSAADIFAENGVPLIKAGNDRVNGWLNVKEYLKVKYDELGQIEELPKMQFFDNCRNVRRCLPLLQHDERKVDDVATEPHDITHTPDALRYYCSRRQLASRESQAEPVDPFKLRKPKKNVVTREYLCGGY